MLLSFTACGKGDGETRNSSQLKVGDFTLLYKSACIMKDYAGDDAIVLTLDFTNNSKKSATYFESIIEIPTQNKEQLEFTAVYVSEESDEMVSDSQMMDVAPGEAIEIKTAFVLTDMTSKVEIRFEEMVGDKNASLTIDPTTLSRESVQSGTSALTGNGKEETSGGEQLRDWWNGDWYGWWNVYGCWGAYEELGSAWWDVCGTIDIGADGTGTVTLWDEDYTKAEPMVSASVSLNSAGVGTHGTMMSEGGTFMDIALEHTDWIVDPGLSEYTDMIYISGSYENGDDQFTYDIFLRPWGTSWDDAKAEDLPYYYHDWYLPLIEAGEPMPDSIG